ncbi:MAG: hypothetical protein WC197_04010 [Candidatus Gastranaerophilaceae bacterium]|jgi:hypothetical protein
MNINIRDIAKTGIKNYLRAEECVKHLAPNPSPETSKAFLEGMDTKKIENTFNRMSPNYLNSLIKYSKKNGIPPEKLISAVVAEKLSAQQATKAVSKDPIYQASRIIRMIADVATGDVFELSTDALEVLGKNLTISLASNAAKSTASKITGVTMDPVKLIMEWFKAGGVEKAMNANGVMEQIKKVVDEGLKKKNLNLN